MTTASRGLTRTFTRRTWYQFGVAAFLLVCWQLADVLLLVFAAVIVAVVLRSVADPIRDHTPLGDKASLLTAAFLILAGLGGAAWLFGSTVSDQVSDLVQRMPRSPEQLRMLLERLPLGGAIADEVTDLGTLASRLRGVAGRLGDYAVTIIGAGANLLVVIVAGVFFAAQPRRTRDGLLLLVPESHAAPLKSALDTSGRALRLWMLGTFADMVVVGVLTAIGAALIGLPSPVALGLFAGLAAFVPIVGPIVSVAPAVLLALQEGPSSVLWAIAVYIAVQQIESNLIFPFIQKRAVDLPPVLALFNLLAFGVLFGPLGVFVGTPLLVVLLVATKILYVRNTLGKPVSVPGETAV